jgi:lipid-A-disaccharide synthase
MNAGCFMLIAGEPSGDLLAAELVKALRKETGATGAQEPQFFGAGGQRMAEAGVELAFDMTEHAVVGLVEVLKNYAKFRRLFNQLLALAIQRKPDAILCVDFSGFNRRFAHAVKEKVRAGATGGWNPKIIQYVSPQVWASREGRAFKMAGDFDLLLSIFPFEKDWYGKRLPKFAVEFVGHPLMERYASFQRPEVIHKTKPYLLLLPGSRAGELKRHLPVMRDALRLIEQRRGVEHKVVLPNQNLLEMAQTIAGPDLHFQVGGLAEALSQADLAIASTGTVTMECAYFGVPTIAMYKTSWSTYQIGKRIIRVKFLAMPNLLADEAIFPEYIQDAANPEALARESLEFMGNAARRTIVKAKLGQVVESLGGAGASERAAKAILGLVSQRKQLEK